MAKSTVFLKSFHVTLSVRSSLTLLNILTPWLSLAFFQFFFIAFLLFYFLCFIYLFCIAFFLLDKIQHLEPCLKHRAFNFYWLNEWMHAMNSWSTATTARGPIEGFPSWWETFRNFFTPWTTYKLKVSRTIIWLIEIKSLVYSSFIMQKEKENMLLC